MKSYEVIEVPYGWRIIENHSNGIKFHTKLFHSEAEAQARAAALTRNAKEASACADVRRRARNRCECLGECGRHRDRCALMHGALLTGQPGTVVLVVLPMDHNAANMDTENLRGYCQLCRQRHDADERNTDPLFEIGG